MKSPSRDPEPLAHEPPEELQRAQEERLLKTWETQNGLRYWSSVNNTDVGLWYSGAAFCFFLFGGFLALLIRVQLALPGEHISLGGYLQSGLHPARVHHDVPFCRADLRGNLDSAAAADARRAGPAFPATLRLWFLELSDRRGLRLRFDTFSTRRQTAAGSCTRR